ncbi:MAG: 2'-5' RNA ligase family protein [Dehalococcoidales bacterium]|nr:2'-5' RNA ligase family protein [Dehalococcoidales bacterium]
MAGFLIEFRMHGYAKKYAKELIYSVAKGFRVKGVTRKKVVPHISLYGPGRTNDLRKVISSVEKVGSKYTLVPFEIKGFWYFKTKSRVIYLDIEPSKELESLRWELSRELRKASSCQTWDPQREFSFHSTIAFKDIDSKFEKIWSDVEIREKPRIRQNLTRITVIGKGGRIICEYDLMLKKLLSRRESLSKYWGRKTIQKLREFQGLPEEQNTLKKNWFQKFFGWSN